MKKNVKSYCNTTCPSVTTAAQGIPACVPLHTTSLVTQAIGDLGIRSWSFKKNSITHTPILQPVFKLSNLSQAVSQHLCCNWKDKALWNEQERFAAKGSAVLNHSLGTRGCGLKSIPFGTENIHPSKIVTSTQGLILEGNTLQEQPSVFSFLLLLTNNW